MFQQTSENHRGALRQNTLSDGFRTSGTDYQHHTITHPTYSCPAVGTGRNQATPYPGQRPPGRESGGICPHRCRQLVSRPASAERIGRAGVQPGKIHQPHAALLGKENASGE